MKERRARTTYHTLISVLIKLWQTFRVHWRDEGSKVDTAAYITLDGYKVPGRYLWGEGETSRGGIRTGPNTERPFTFDNFDEGILFCLEIVFLATSGLY